MTHQAAPAARRTRWWPGIVAAAAIGTALFMGLAAAMQPRCAARESARRINCAGNLKQIGLALIIYADDDRENGYFPPSLAHLDSDGYLTCGKVYVCPSRKGPVRVPEHTVDLDDPRYCSYTYLGAGQQDRDPHPAVLPIAYCRHHGGEWINVLFLDGHVRGYQPEQWLAFRRREGIHIRWELERTAAR